MKLKLTSVSWEFNGNFCCKRFRFYSVSVPIVFTDGKDIFFNGNKISYCPYCGKKIVLEKEVGQ